MVIKKPLWKTKGAFRALCSLVCSYPLIVLKIRTPATAATNRTMAEEAILLPLEKRNVVYLIPFSVLIGNDVKVCQVKTSIKFSSVLLG